VLDVQSPYLAVQLLTAPFLSQVLSPGDPHDRHFSFVSPHQSESQLLKSDEQHAFSEGTSGVGEGVVAGGFPVGGVGGGDWVGGDGSTIQGADAVSGLQIIPGQHGFL